MKQKKEGEDRETEREREVKRSTEQLTASQPPAKHHV